MEHCNALHSDIEVTRGSKSDEEEPVVLKEKPEVSKPEGVRFVQLSLGGGKDRKADKNTGANVTLINIRSEYAQVGKGNEFFYRQQNKYASDSEESEKKKSVQALNFEMDSTFQNCLRFSDIKKQSSCEHSQVNETEEPKELELLRDHRQCLCDYKEPFSKNSFTDSSAVSFMQSIFQRIPEQGIGENRRLDTMSSFLYLTPPVASVKEIQINDEVDFNKNSEAIADVKNKKAKLRRKLVTCDRRLWNCSEKEIKEVSFTIRQPRRLLSPASLSESCTDLCKVSDVVMKQLQFPRDNGRWEQFDLLVAELSNRFTSPEAKIVILLEESMAACYQDRLDESEEMIKRALEKSKYVANASILIGRAHHYLSSVYRRQKNKLGEAFTCVQIAEQNFHSTPLIVDTSLLTYERASVLINFISLGRDPSTALVNEARTYLIKCINECRALEQDEPTERYVKMHHFALIKMAMLLLDCRTKSGRAHHYLSSVYRRQKNKLGEAFTCVQIAEQNFHSTPLIVDTSLLTYERASVLINFISLGRDPSTALVNEARTYLIKCINECRALEQDEPTERYVKMHHFALIKMAMLLLDCRTKSGRQRAVSDDRIKHAKDCLDNLKDRYWEGISQGEKVQFYMVQIDLHYRLQNYQRAEKIAELALKMAEEYGFKTEIQSIIDRQVEVRRHHAKHSHATPSSYDDRWFTVESSEGRYGDVSSESESDWLLAGDEGDVGLILS